MREIKFRAWDKEENRMIYSDEKLPYDAWFSLDNGTVQCFINYAYCDSFGDEHDDWQPLDNIMQYTGLKDKNGKEIYEGDILECILGWKYVVEWGDDECARFIGYTIENERKIVYVGREPKSEVIGNIYENPELLEVEQ